MKAKTRWGVLLSSLLFAGSASAALDVCPSIDDIREEGVSMSEAIAENVYMTYQLSDYYTDSSWGFLIAPITADDNDDAIDQANGILDQMSAPGVAIETSGMLVCTYETGVDKVFAAAIRDDYAVTPAKLKQFFKSRH